MAVSLDAANPYEEITAIGKAQASSTQTQTTNERTWHEKQLHNEE
jgi:hypothetical protein